MRLVKQILAYTVILTVTAPLLLLLVGVIAAGHAMSHKIEGSTIGEIGSMVLAVVCIWGTIRLMKLMVDHIAHPLLAWANQKKKYKHYQYDRSDESNLW
jgi:hypothetical protein